MSRICEITGKKALSGNNVSHANNKTKRKFYPNLQNVRLFSHSLKRYLSLKITVRTMRTIEKNGGIDSFLLNSSNRKLAPIAIKLKKSILKTEKNKS